MSKKNNLEHEAIMTLRKNIRFGNSKFEDKKAAIEKAKAQGKVAKNVKGYYSTASYDDAVKKTNTFINYCMNNHSKEIKHYSDCRQFMEEYLQDCKDRDVSAWTTHAYFTVLCRSFDIDAKDVDFKKDKRCRSDIKRNRNQNTSRFVNVDGRHKELHDFFRATGCRRGEALKLRKQDIKFSNDGKVIFLFLRGKGGTERWAPVNPEYNDLVLDFFNRKTYTINGEERLFKKSSLPKEGLHDLRALYAYDMYQLYDKGGKVATGEMYHCRGDMKGIVFDKGILKAVSENMGHHRCDVVVSNYLSACFDTKAS